MWLSLTTKYTSAHTRSHHAGAHKHALFTQMTSAQTHKYTSRVQNHIYTQEHLVAINHIHTHTHTAAVHTSPLLVQTQTPHASAPHSMSRRPQEQKKKQMGTSCLDEGPGYTATVLWSHTYTHTHTPTQRHTRECMHEQKPHSCCLTASNDSSTSWRSIHR